MPPEIHHTAAPRSLVPPPVVGHRGDVRQPPHHAAEALPSVERAVHEDHGRRTRPGAGPREDVEGGRIAHGQGRRYLERPLGPIATGRVGS